MSDQTPEGGRRADWEVSAPPAFALEPLPGPPGTLVLRLAGELDVATSGTLREHVDVALAASARAVVLDFEAVSFMDSSALRELIRAQATLRAANGLVVLVAAQPMVRRLLDLTGTAELFAHAPTREDALALATAPPPVTPSG